MKKITNLFALSIIMLLSVSSFAKSLNPLNYANHSVRSFNRQINEYKIRIIVDETGTDGTYYNYSIFAYVYDANGNPNSSVTIPSDISIYGSLTISGQTSPIVITIPPAGYYSEYWTSIPQLTAANLQANYLSTYSLGGIPITSEPITFK